MQIHVSPNVMQMYPGVSFGFLAIENLTNPAVHPGLEAQKIALEAELRLRWRDAAAVKSDEVIQAYTAYYKRFKKSYHVALQLESVALKGKSIPSVAALVECMFMAELADCLLTAGHDLDAVRGDVTVCAADGSEIYTLMRGEEQQEKPGDLHMRDEEGIISSIIYGPDRRTQIVPATTRALFTVYAPPGVGQMRVHNHTMRILDYIRLFSPDLQVSLSLVV